MYSYLAHARPDPGHWLPVVRVEAALHPVELMARLAPCRIGEGAQVIERGSKEGNRLHGARPAYIVIDIISRAPDAQGHGRCRRRPAPQRRRLLWTSAKLVSGVAARVISSRCGLGLSSHP